MTAYRAPAPKPPETPAPAPTIEEIIAADVTRHTEGIEKGYALSLHIEQYVRARLEAQEKGYSWLRLWWQDFFVVYGAAGREIRRQEREWAEERAQLQHKTALRKILGMIKEEP